MVRSAPNLAVCQILLDAESVLGRRLYSGGLRQDAAQSRNAAAQGFDDEYLRVTSTEGEEEEKYQVLYASRDPMKDNRQGSHR